MHSASQITIEKWASREGNWQLWNDAEIWKQERDFQKYLEDFKSTASRLFSAN